MKERLLVSLCSRIEEDVYASIILPSLSLTSLRFKEVDAILKDDCWLYTKHAICKHGELNSSLPQFLCLFVLLHSYSLSTSLRVGSVARLLEFHRRLIYVSNIGELVTTNLTRQIARPKLAIAAIESKP